MENRSVRVVLLHSALGDSRLWKRQVAALEREHHVVAPDLPGWGENPLPTEPFSLVDFTAEFLPGVLVGNSFGGAGRVADGARAPRQGRAPRARRRRPARLGLDGGDARLLRGGGAGDRVRRPRRGDRGEHGVLGQAGAPRRGAAAAAARTRAADRARGAGGALAGDGLALDARDADARDRRHRRPRRLPRDRRASRGRDPERRPGDRPGRRPPRRDRPARGAERAAPRVPVRVEHVRGQAPGQASSDRTASDRRGHASAAQSPNARSVRHASAIPASGSTQRNVPLRPKWPNVRGELRAPVQCGALPSRSSRPRPQSFGSCRPKPGQDADEPRELDGARLVERLVRDARRRCSSCASATRSPSVPSTPEPAEPSSTAPVPCHTDAKYSGNGISARSSTWAAATSKP